MTDERKKVVIIDDEEDVVTYLSAMLTDNGFDVESATDGYEGLALIKKVKPHLICLDILMPGETGFSLFKKISMDTDLMEIPVIIISGMNYQEEVEKQKNGSSWFKPPAGYIEKPVMPDQFLDTVKGVIG